jgi:hypothetical protein
MKRPAAACGTASKQARVGKKAGSGADDVMKRPAAKGCFSDFQPKQRKGGAGAKAKRTEAAEEYGRSFLAFTTALNQGAVSGSSADGMPPVVVSGSSADGVPPVAVSGSSADGMPPVAAHPEHLRAAEVAFAAYWALFTANEARFEEAGVLRSREQLTAERAAYAAYMVLFAAKIEADLRVAGVFDPVIEVGGIATEAGRHTRRAAEEHFAYVCSMPTVERAAYAAHRALFAARVEAGVMVLPIESDE